MGMCHVTIVGRDRQHLTSIGPKLRVIVVGFREDERGAVVDTYVQENKINWLRRQGCEVNLLERIDLHDKERQKEGRAAVESRLKRGRYGDVIWGGGYLNVDEVEAAMVLGEKTIRITPSYSPCPISPGRSGVATLFGSARAKAKGGWRCVSSAGCTPGSGAVRT